MTDTPAPGDAERHVDEIVDAAKRLGVELNREEAVQWIVALSAAEREAGVAHDARTGVFGNRIALLDFVPGRWLPAPGGDRAVEPRGVVRAGIMGNPRRAACGCFPATRISSSVNIHAADADTARAVLGGLLRATALRAFGNRVWCWSRLIRRVPVAVRGAARRARRATRHLDARRRAARHDQRRERGRTAAHAALGHGAVRQGWNYLGWIVADREAGASCGRATCWT
jgi:hypothetical protein